MNRILIVDDEPSIVELLEEFLQGEGYTTERAFSGEEALAKFSKFAPDLVLLDYVLPGMSGLQTCQRLRADVRSSQVPVIMLTACSDSSNVVASYRSGVNDYILKPFDAADLSVRVHAQLHNFDYN